MMYHLVKQTRNYEGRAYCGSTSNNIPAEFQTLEDAKIAQAKFNAKNPVGWVIYFNGEEI